MTDNILSYCPGCGHGTTHRILAEVIDEAGLQSQTIGVSPVGCSVLMYNYIDVDIQEAAHGGLRQLQQLLNGFCPTNLFLPIRAMEILQLLELLKQFMPATGEKTSSSFSLIMVFTE